MSATATDARKPAAPEGVDQSALDQVVEATERRMSDTAILHVYEHLDAYKGVAASIARSGLTHHKTEAHVITIAIAAYEMNLGVMEALRGMYLVGGKIAMETWLMDSIATRLGVSKTVHEAGLTRCRLTLHHRDRPDITVEYTLEDAKRAGIIRDFDPETGEVQPQPRRDNWAKHTEEMVFWRCLSKGLRRIAPDLFGGVYTTDEAESIDRRKDGSWKREATDTNAALDALKEGVEPDPDEYTEDEIEAYCDEVREARKRSLVTDSDAEHALGLVDEGQWAEMREQQEGVRSLIANAKAEEHRGDLFRENP